MTFSITSAGRCRRQGGSRGGDSVWQNRAPKRLGIPEHEVTEPTRPFTLWTVVHPELFIDSEVPARSAAQACRVAWTRWYRHPVQTGLDELMRDAFEVRDTGKPSEEGVVSSAGTASGP